MHRAKLFAAVICCYSISLSVYMIVYNSPVATIYTRDLNDLIDRVADEIHNTNSAIGQASREGDAVKSQKVLMESHQKLNVILNMLGRSDVASTLAVNNNLNEMARSEVCPEHYDHSYFEKGFHVKKCTGVPDFHSLLTLVYNFVNYDSHDLTRIPTIVKSVNKYYPKLKIIAAIPRGFSVKSKHIRDTEFISVNASVADTDLWNSLISKVKTKYVYIGRNVIHFTKFDRLERLVQESADSNTYAVASAYRTLHSGKWSNGCEQSVLRNYTLVYTSGYEISVEECLLCHHVHGPFLSKTEVLKKNPLEPKMTATSGFAVWFLKMKSLGKTVIACPDSMAFLTDKSQLPTKKSDWTDLAQSLQVEQVSVNPDQLIEFNCSEARSSCPKVRFVGVSLSRCCIQELADGIKLVMRKCKEEGMLCEVDSGTLLGAVKFNGVLPWELDADLRVHPNNYTAFAGKLKPYFTKRGYNWTSDVASIKGPNNHLLFSKNWKIEVWEWDGLKKMGSELFSEEGIDPTLIYFDGDYITGPQSPGLTSRNEYGYGIYKHVQHWIQTGQALSDDMKYKTRQFTACPHPGHHACLDQYVPDGNIKYKNPTPQA